MPNIKPEMGPSKMSIQAESRADAALPTHEKTRSKGKLLEDNFDFKYYWPALKRYKWVILLFAAALTLLSILIVTLIAPTYRSSATLLIEGNQSKVLPTAELYALDTSKVEYFQTQVEILKSPDLARRVIKEVRLAEQPEFKNAYTKVNSTQSNDKARRIAEENLLKKFLAQLSVKGRAKTQLIDISFDAKDPKLAQTIVNKLGNSFIESVMEARLENIRSAVDWLGVRLQSLKAKVTDSEGKLQNFLDTEHLVDLQGVLTLIGKEIDQNTIRLSSARQARLEAGSIYDRVNQLPGAESIPDMMPSSNLRNLKEKRSELASKIAKLSLTHGPNHPEILAMRAELNTIEEFLNKEIRNIKQTLKNNYEVAKTNEQAIIRTIEENKRQIFELSRKQNRLLELRRDVDSNRHLYETFVNRFKEASEAASSHEALIRFIDQADLPVLPIKPRKSLVVALSCLGALLLGAVLAILFDFLAPTIKSADELKRKLERPFLGEVPIISSQEIVWLDKSATTESQCALVEAMRTIQTNLMLPVSNNSGHSWVITSSIANEGKSTFAMSLAQALAQAVGNENRVLLIDADLRQPSLQQHFALPRQALGLNHILTMNAKISRCVYSITGLNMDVLPAGIASTNPLPLLSSKSFTKLLNILKQHYRIILFDAPAINNANDVLWLAKQADSVIYVVRNASTPIAAVRQGLEMLDSSGSMLAGMVLTQVDSKQNNFAFKHWQPAT